MSKIVSFTELNALGRCKWAWGVGYRASLQSTADKPAMSFGGLMHDILAAHYLGVPFDIAELGRKNDPPPDADALADAIWLYDLYREHYAADDEMEVLAAEWPFRVNVQTPHGTRANYVLVGWMDLITKDPDNRIWIWDHKTGKSWPSVINLALDFQLSTYAWALSQMGADVAGVVLNLLRTTKKTGKDRFMRDRLLKPIEEIDEWGNTLYWRCRDFPPPRIPWLDLPKTTSRDCSWCDHYDLCRFHQEGQLAAMKDLIEVEYRQKKSRWPGWLKQYNRELPEEWLRK